MNLTKSASTAATTTSRSPRCLPGRRTRGKWYRELSELNRRPCLNIVPRLLLLLILLPSNRQHGKDLVLSRLSPDPHSRRPSQTDRTIVKAACPLTRGQLSPTDHTSRMVSTTLRLRVQHPRCDHPWTSTRRHCSLVKFPTLHTSIRPHHNSLRSIQHFTISIMLQPHHILKSLAHTIINRRRRHQYQYSHLWLHLSLSHLCPQ